MLDRRNSGSGLYTDFCIEEYWRLVVYRSWLGDRIITLELTHQYLIKPYYRDKTLLLAFDSWIGSHNHCTDSACVLFYDTLKCLVNDYHIIHGKEWNEVAGHMSLLTILWGKYYAIYLFQLSAFFWLLIFCKKNGMSTKNVIKKPVLQNVKYCWGCQWHKKFFVPDNKSFISTHYKVLKILSALKVRALLFPHLLAGINKQMNNGFIFF